MGKEGEKKVKAQRQADKCASLRAAAKSANERLAKKPKSKEAMLMKATVDEKSAKCRHQRALMDERKLKADQRLKREDRNVNQRLAQQKAAGDAAANAKTA